MQQAQQCDGFSTANEQVMGTDPLVAVSSNNINISDVLSLKPFFGKSCSP